MTQDFYEIITVDSPMWLVAINSLDLVACSRCLGNKAGKFQLGRIKFVVAEILN